MLNERLKLWYSAARLRHHFGKWKQIPMGPPSASIPKTWFLAHAPVGCCHSDPCRDKGHGSGHKLNLDGESTGHVSSSCCSPSHKLLIKHFTNSTRTTGAERCCVCWALVWKIHLQRGWADTAVRSRIHNCFQNPSELGLLQGTMNMWQ